MLTAPASHDPDSLLFFLSSCLIVDSRRYYGYPISPSRCVQIPIDLTMRSQALTVEDYLASLPADRREAILAIRAVILQNLDADFTEGMTYGMIGYFVPHSRYPAGYHCNPKDPLPYINLASQKNHMALYLMSVYMNPDLQKRLVDAWKKTGKKLDMGKSCIRFKKLEDVPLEVVGDIVRQVPAADYIALYESNLNRGSTTGSDRNSTQPSKSRSKVDAANKTTGSKSAAPQPAAKRESTSNRKSAASKSAKKGAAKKSPKNKSAKSAGKKSGAIKRAK